MLGNSIDKQYVAEQTVTSFTKTVIGEWNMNLYTNIIFGSKVGEVDPDIYGTESPEFYKAYFPLTEVVRGWRPKSGIYKPRWGNLSSSSSNKQNLRMRSSGWRNSVYECGQAVDDNTWTLKPRIYFPRYIDDFKYFDSPYAVTSAHYVDPYVKYQSPVWTNKIVMKFQTVNSRPNAYTIEYLDTSNVWQVAATSPTVPGSGVVEIYRVGGTWSTSVPTPANMSLSNAIKIKGLRVVVTSMKFASGSTDKRGHLGLIEMSPRVQVDLTSRVKQWSIYSNISENDSIFPVGTVSSNSGSITLSNNDGELEPGQAGGSTPTLADIVKKDGKITVKYKANTPGASTVIVGTMYIQEPVISGNRGSLEMQLYDRAKKLQETKAPELTLERVSPTAAIWTVLDHAGHNNVIIKHNGSADNPDAEPIINWFYSRNEQTVWEVIQEICASHQYSVYVDEEDNIIILTRDYLYKSRPDNFVFTTEPVTDALDYKANVSDIDDSVSEIINSANVTFTPRFISSDPDPGQDKIQRTSRVAFSRVRTLELFRPNDPVLLGCASLRQNMTSNQTYCVINPTSLRNAEWGSFSGYAMLDAEIISFDGLQFAYTPKSGAPASPRVARSREELQEILAYAQGIVTFTGKLMNVKRGQLGTTAAAHNTVTSKKAGWNMSRFSSIKTDPTGNKFLSIRYPGATARRVSVSSRIMASNSRWTNTRMIIEGKVNKVKARNRRGGVMVSATVSGANTSGIYVEVNQQPSSKDGVVSVYRVNDNIMASKPYATAVARVIDDKPFELSVHFRQGKTSTERLITVYIDGTRVLTDRFTTSIPMTNRIGLCSSGDSFVKFDYVAGGLGIVSDYQTRFDGKLRKYVEHALQFDRSQSDTVSMPSLTGIGFERFDDYVREIYFNELRFERSPAISFNPVYTSLILRDRTNKQNVALGGEIAGAIVGESPFGAKLLVANVSSRPLFLANVKDDGTALYPYIYGYVVQEYEQQKVEKTNELSVLRNGEKKADFSAKWITNRVAAQRVADWIVSRKANGTQEVRVSVFSGHLTQLADSVRVYSTEKNVDDSFIVVERNLSDSGDGISSRFTLVKV